MIDLLMTVRYRFAISIFSNIFRSLIGFLIILIIAHLLGAHIYGNFVFLTGFFIAYRSLSDLGVSRAFYCFISQQGRCKTFILIYFAWLAIQCIGPLILIGLMFPTTWISYIWVGASRNIILLAFFAVFLREQAWQALVLLFESKRLTTIIQPINLAISIIYLFSILFLYYLRLLNLKTLFILIIGEYLVFIILAFFLYKYCQRSPILQNNSVIKKASVKEILKEYCEYCRPLVWFATLTFVYSLTDRWLLQHYSGAIAQAYYGLGAYFSSGCLIATSAMLNVFLKEISSANFQHNIGRMKTIYHRTLVFLFMTSACVVGFLIPWSKEIVRMILGSAYVGGYIAFAIMLLFPVHQTMNAVCQSMFYAVGDTKAVAIILAVFRLLSIPVAYLILASPNALIPGLHSGAIGLGIKMVVFNILTVNMMAWWIAKKYKWKFCWKFQLMGILLTLFVGYMVYFGFLCCSLWVPVKMVLSLVVYLFVLAVACFYRPSLFGLTKDDRNIAIAGVIKIKNKIF